MTNKDKKPLIGFVGQGWIGRNMADSYESRDYQVIRYGLESEYVNNRSRIADCDIVFIAVPTPTTPDGFDYSAVQSALGIVGQGKTAIIRSTLIPGTTDSLSADFDNLFVIHSPEFLREVSARYDIDNPDRNIIGIPTKHFQDKQWVSKAQAVMDIMPEAPNLATYKLICTSTEAEFIKHGGNEFLYLKTVFMNILYDAASSMGGSWEVISKAMTADPRIGTSHMSPVHQYGHMDKRTGRGAGGHCFPKDWASFCLFYESVCPDDSEGIAFLRAVEAKNISLLLNSDKDFDILSKIYGNLTRKQPRSEVMDEV